ncbi:MAG: sulfite exporter TauE/SafE family protein [Myxococcaceae bacterium]
MLSSRPHLMPAAIQLSFLFVASIAAGALNALAGGGTLFTFPALLAAGVTPVAANATSTVALVPGSLTAGWGYRREVGSQSGRVLAFLVIPSLAGGLLGAWLVPVVGDALFRRLVPGLILGATALFIIQEPFRRWRERRTKEDEARGLHDLNLWGLAAGQFVVSVYGGFFGAGIGILMLAELGLMGLSNIHQMNGLKNFGAACINGIAAVYFAIYTPVRWPLAALMAVGSVFGGYAGAWLAQRIGERMVRAVIIVAGLGIGLWMLAK